MPERAPAHSTLRERKRQRTRAALVEAGRRLFEDRGYDGTTIADIAAEAEIGTRTFFGYFDSKERLLFPESDARVNATVTAIETRRDGETPVEVLLRALDDATQDDDLISPLAQLRLRLMRDVPAVQGSALRLQMEAQRIIAMRLVQAYPELDEVAAAALVGAFVGAAAGAVQALDLRDAETRDPDTLRKQLRAVVAAALGRQ